MSALPVPKFNIGDTVYRVSTTTEAGQHPCPDCLGSRVWPVTSPAGVAMQMDCPRCTQRSCRTELSLHYAKHVPFVQRLTIGSVRIDTACLAREVVSYMCEETGIGSGAIHYESTLHATEEAAKAEAEAQCAVLQSKTDARPEAMRQAELASMGYFYTMMAEIRRETRNEEKAYALEDAGRLAQSAPAMLAALKKIVRDWDGEPDDMQEAKEAIAAAGPQP